MFGFLALPLGILEFVFFDGIARYDFIRVRGIVPSYSLKKQGITPLMLYTRLVCHDSLLKRLHRALGIGIGHKQLLANSSAFLKIPQFAPLSSMTWKSCMALD